MQVGVMMLNAEGIAIRKIPVPTQKTQIHEKKKQEKIILKVG